MSLLGKRKINDSFINDSPFKKIKLQSCDMIGLHRFSSFICNNYSSFIINKDKNVFSFGCNSWCNLGHNNKDNNNIILYPKQIDLLSNIKMISCGFYHTVCIDYNGNVFSFGRNSFGQLGNNDLELKDTYIPQKIDLPPIKQITCGKEFTICLTKDGIVFSFGRGDDGQLGLGNYNNYSSPQQIIDLYDIDFIISCLNRVICKSLIGDYYSWGYLQYKDNSNTIIYINKPILCQGWIDNIIDIKCGFFHSLLLSITGLVYILNEYSYDEIKQGFISKPILINNIPKIKRIECGSSHSICIDITNKLWVFGDNTCGQLGLGDTKKRNKPIHNIFFKNIKDISSGGSHVFIKTKTNKIFGYGMNTFSQIGEKTKENNQLKPIEVLSNYKDIWSSSINIKNEIIE